jgi:hypothetical protein
VCLYVYGAGGRTDIRTGVEITSRILALYHFTLNFGLIAEAANLFSDLRIQLPTLWLSNASKLTFGE